MIAARRAALALPRRTFFQTQAQRNFPSIVTGVEFDTIAREWRCKWSGDNDKKSLEEVQKALVEVMPKVAAVSGSRTQRVVCGGCLDFKVVTSLKADKLRSGRKRSL